MKKQDGFYFIPKKWLGDANVIAMDWDCKGMHLHLMAIAWQQELKGYLIDDDKLIRKLLSNPEEKDWEERIKPQIFSAWKKKAVEENGIKRQYWYQPGIIKTTQDAEKEVITERKPRQSRKIKEEVENPEFEGFNLKSILDSKPTTTILHEQATQEERGTIWTLGIQLLKKPGDVNDNKARGMIAKLAKEYGDKSVAAAIAKLSLKPVSPVEAHSYLIGILKKQQTEADGPKKTGRGSVSI